MVEFIQTTGDVCLNYGSDNGNWENRFEKKFKKLYRFNLAIRLCPFGLNTKFVWISVYTFLENESFE